MKAGVITFPGSNCDDDLRWILQDLGCQTISLWHKDTDLKGCNIVFLPGGFSYGDYLRTGALAKFSPIVKEVVRFANRGGAVAGICNGFQILTETGLLPGALVRNKNLQFICQNQYLKPDNFSNPITKELEKKTYNIPIAHADGNFYCDDKTLASIENNGQVLFRYCDKYGQTNEGTNPNGSRNHIAGICNERKNVMGMMPHPERSAHPLFKNTDGRLLLTSLLNNV